MEVEITLREFVEKNFLARKGKKDLSNDESLLKCLRTQPTLQHRGPSRPQRGTERFSCCGTPSAELCVVGTHETCVRRRRFSLRATIRLPETTRKILDP